jgi:hypothetical protein
MVRFARFCKVLYGFVKVLLGFCIALVGLVRNGNVW